MSNKYISNKSGTVALVMNYSAVLCSRVLLDQNAPTKGGPTPADQQSQSNQQIKM